MRVLFLASQPWFQWRGSPIRVAFDVRALAELGHEVDLLVLPVGEDLEIPGVNVLRLPRLPGVRNVPIGPSFLKLVYDGIMFVRCLGLVRKRRYGAIHAVEDAGMVGIALRAAARNRLVFEKHSDPGSYRRGALLRAAMWLYGKVERFTMRRADAVIGTGPGLIEQARVTGTRAQLHHIFDIPSSLTEASPDGVARARQELEQAPGELLILYVGSFAAYQGVDLMFEAMPEVIGACHKARFVVVGGTPEEIARRGEWLAARGIEQAVTFTGKIAPDRLPDYLAACDLLLSPRMAGVNTPLKLLDYLKAGRAIVATDTEANRLLLSDEVALLVAPEPPAMARGICELLADAPRRAELGRCGRRLVDEKYNFTEFKRRLGACYEGLTRNADR